MNDDNAQLIAGHPTTPLAPISILACGGTLPLEIAQILREQDRSLNIVSITGVADADYSAFPMTSVSIKRIGALLAALRAHGARDMIIAGHARRPDLRGFDIDWGFIRHFLTILSLTRGGDDRVLRGIAAFFERQGLTVRSIAEVAPALLTPPGVLSGTLSPATAANAEQGLKLVHQLGPFDVGQAAIIDAHGAVAIEGAEATNGLISRSSAICRASSDRVLIKAAKPEQDLRLDLPTIGPETVARCAGSGIKTIALEAGRSLILSRDETLRDADKAGIAVVGLETASAAPGMKTAPGPRHRPVQLRNLTRAVAKPNLIRDAQKGLQLLSVVKDHGAVAAVVARENVIAVDLNEPLSDFIDRTEQLGQWSDRRQKTKRNRVLVLTSIPAPEADLFAHLNQTKIAGVAVLETTGDPGHLDRLVDDADKRTLFVLSPG